MSRVAVFLAGINLGRRRVKMAELRRHLEGAQPGVEGVETLLASGNVVLTSEIDDLTELEASLERHLEAALGFATATFVRSRGELEEVCGAAEPGRDKGFNPHVLFLRDAPPAVVRERLGELTSKDDHFDVVGRHVIWLRRGGLSEGPITTQDLRRALGGAAHTARNLNTAQRVLARL